MKSLIKISSLLILIVVLVSCHNKRNRQVQYMGDTDMYDPVSYETYSSNPILKNNMSAQLPVIGTVARGKIPYDFSNDEEGYQMAKDSLQSPLLNNDKNLAQGKYLFDIYCAVCHGVKGDGQGVLVKNEKFLGVPNYKDRAITQGSIYHVIMYGRNLMGSHASQLNIKERWQVAQYVEKLRNDLLK
jgi:hypothetical protein